ncbi:MAG: hypothetical protein JJE13_11620 [Thermoleophilia bacterium]|nr:hypothetical protein [Thermoleophilia bacterium]
MSKTSKFLVATALLAFVAAGFSGCGEDRSNLIPSSEAKQIDASLTEIQALADTNQCFRALKGTKNVLKQVEGLPQSVDPDLKRSLLDGVVALQLLIGDASKCTQDTTTEPTEPETDTEITPTGDTGVTTPEETTTDEEKDTGKKDTGKKPETPAPTPEPSPTPTPETPPDTGPPVDPGPGSGGVSPNQ